MCYYICDEVISMIKYDKLLALLKNKGYTTYRIRKTGLLGGGTWTAVQAGGGELSIKTVDRLCRVLDCQPGDLMEYVPDE